MEREPLEILGYDLNFVYNRAENEAAEVINRIVGKEAGDMCLCQICVEDIYAITMNNLQPHYINENGINIVRQKTDAATIEGVVRKAMGLVRSRPNHA